MACHGARAGQVDYSASMRCSVDRRARDPACAATTSSGESPTGCNRGSRSWTTTSCAQTLKARAIDVGKRYRGRFAEYDLNNEMLHGNYYEQRLGPEITREMASWVQAGGPQCGAVSQRLRHPHRQPLDDYVAQIRKFLDQGVPIGGIGVQGHLHGDTFDPAALRNSLDQLAQFKLPIRVTEFNFPGQRSKYYRRARRSPHGRGGAGQSQGAGGLLPHLLRASGRRGHPDVGLLGRSQLDSRLLALPARLDADARRPKPIATWCSTSGGRSGAAKPTPRESAKFPRFSANTESRRAAKKSSFN